MVEGAEFSVMHFQLKPDDKLVLMSDPSPKPPTPMAIYSALSAYTNCRVPRRVPPRLQTPRTPSDRTRTLASFPSPEYR